ncbi:MAG: alkaline phosphatase family protein [Actinomycetota bacterium]
MKQAEGREIGVSKAPKVLIIGLDALTPRLVEKWVAEDRLPNISRFLTEGAWGPMSSVPNRNSAPAWSTMVTGLNPGKHGIYWFTEDKPETYEYQFINGSYRRGKAFWRLLSEEGQRVSVMNVPLTFPAEEVNGVFVSGLDSPSAEDPRFTYPSELRHEVISTAGGEYYVYPALARFVVAGQADEGLDRLHRSIDKRAAVAEHLMGSREWDTFMVVFTESDVVQHFFWQHMDDPASEDPQRHRDAIRDTYEHLDAVVGELMSKVDDDTVVVLVSDHGARHEEGLARTLPNWLGQLGLLTYREEERKTSARSVAFSTISKLFRRLDKTLSPEMKHKLSRRFPWLRRRVEVMMSFAKVDWSKTKAYTDGKRPEIWINLQGRQSQGIVAPEDYESVRQEIIDRMSSAVCVKTGQPLVRRVLRREEAYSGPYVERSPDLVVQWMDEGACFDIRYPDGTNHKLQKQHLPDDPFDHLVNGGHDQYGIVALLGPGVKAGHIEDAQIADVAPTVLFLRDAAIPSDVDGKVLTDAFDEEVRSARTTRRGAEATMKPDEGAGYSEEEEAEIRERLRSLGYVE